MAVDAFDVLAAVAVPAWDLAGYLSERVEL